MRTRSAGGPRPLSAPPHRIAALAAASALAVTAAVALGATPAPAHAAPAAHKPQPAKTVTHTVTLITGDRVTTVTRGKTTGLTITPGAGRAGQGMMRWRYHGHEHVLPADAAPLVAAGHLDQRLFDITQLIADGYDDSAAPALPLIVQYTGGSTSARSLTAAGAAAARTFPRIAATALRQPRAKAATLWSTLSVPAKDKTAARTLAPSIRGVWLDGKSHLTLDKSVPQIGAPAVWQDGHTGEGVTVAVLDTGYDPTHPDLQGVVKDSKNFTTDADTVDHDGHGTHVAGTIAGSGAASQGRYKGVAPGANLLIGKVCTDTGCPDSAILAGIDWAATQGARIVSMSLGRVDSAGLDPVEQAVETYSHDKGILFVIAGGNEGPGIRTLDSPGSAPSALSVAAVDSADALAGFSSRGPAATGDLLKPDVSAPGVRIVSARAAGTRSGQADGEFYTRLSGTSMATPHVAGAAALLASAHPDWTAEQLKSALRSTAQPATGENVFAQGAGRIDVGKASGQQVFAEPSVLSFGSLTAPAQQNVTYRNSGSAPVTLHLALQGATDGFGISPADLTIPAGGTASATVTADMTGQPVTHGGWITASASDGTTVRTAVGATHEPDRDYLSLEMTDRLGHIPNIEYFASAVAINHETGEVTNTVYGTNGRPSLYLAAGDYTVLGSTGTYDGQSISRTLEVKSGVHFTGHRATLKFDARDGEYVDLHTDRPDAAVVDATLRIQASAGGGSASIDEHALPSFPGLYVVPGTRDPQIRVTVQGTLAKPSGPGAFSASPYLYHLLRTFDGETPHGRQYFPDSSLAAVPTTYAAARSERQEVVSYAYPGSDGTDTIGYGGIVDHVTPFQRVEYFTRAPARWSHWIRDAAAGSFSYTRSQQSDPTAYQEGQSYTARWNGGVLGMGFRAGSANAPSRYGNSVYADLHPFSDGTPGHWGDDEPVTSTKTLYDASGQQLSTGPLYSAFVSLALPDGATGQRYTAVIDASRSTAGLSATRSTLSWTFTAPSGDGRVMTLPLPKLNPSLDSANSAPVGEPLTIPVSVQQHPDAPDVNVASVTVEASFDDGATWQDAPVLQDGDSWAASVTGSAPGWVSLRTAITSTDGTRTQQTTIHAYTLR